MKTAALSILLASICLLPGCNKRPHFQADAYVLIRQPVGTPYDPSFFAAEVNAVQTLASSILPEDAEAAVVHMIPKTELIRIVVTMPDPARAADLCNRIADTYVAQAKEGVKKSLSKKAVAPTAPTR